MEGSMEEFIYEFIDQCKLLFFPEKWNNTFLDYSKNEAFVLFYLYRKNSANMTELADYISVPLNTATGIVSRLEKRGVIKRERDIIDKRVVTIKISVKGKEFFAEQLALLEHFYQEFMSSITEEEKVLLLHLISKFLDLAANEMSSDVSLPEAGKKVKRITIE